MAGPIKTAKFTGIFLMVVLPAQLFAQHLSGRVIDTYTRLPVAYATITANGLTTSTTVTGSFILTSIHNGDKVSITSIGYKPYEFTFNKAKPDTITIYLEQVSIMLKDVSIRAGRNYQADSLRNRKDFASVFDRKAPTWNDAFIKKDPYKYVPYNYIDAPNSTASIVSVDLLQVIDLLSKNKNPETKLQKTLIADEQNNYVDHVFSKQKITAITSLKGDSLRDFMDEYRPGLAQVKKMTDYDMIKYIKKSYAEFLKVYKAGNGGVFGK